MNFGNFIVPEHPDVISVFPNKGRKLHTTRSWDFLGLERNRVISQVWKNGRFGEDTIIGNLDTGTYMFRIIIRSKFCNFIFIYALFFF